MSGGQYAGLVLVHIVATIVALQFWASRADVFKTRLSEKVFMAANFLMALWCVYGGDRYSEASLWLLVLSSQIHAIRLKAKIARLGGAS